jgi:hypothetical protein
MINPARQSSQFSRREALQKVGATAALVIASGVDDLTGDAHAETPIVQASNRAGPGFWQNAAPLALACSADILTPTLDTIEALAVNLVISKTLYTL